MPRYVIVIGPCDEALYADAEAVLASRYPEVAIESRCVIGDALWQIVCRAPSSSHIERWLSSEHVTLSTLNPRTL